MSDHSELKHFQRLLTEANGRLHELRSEQTATAEKLKNQQALVRDLETRIRVLKQTSGGVVVSEHAILRYLERVVGLDIEAAKREILPPDVERSIQVIGTGSFPLREGVTLRVQRGVVTTVITREGVGQD